MSSKKAIIGVDLGATNIHSLLMSEEGEILARDFRPTLGQEGREKTISQIVSSIKSLQEKGKNLGVSSFLGIGVGSPGPLNVEKGVIYHSPNIQEWENLPLVNILQERLGLPVFLENDANAAALGEWWRGAGRGVNYFFLLTLGTGIGGGIVINGEIYHGAWDAGAELGHMIIKEGGMICGCGARGCLEAYAAAPGVVKRAKAVMKQGHSTLLYQLTGGDENALTAEMVFKAAKEGDEVARYVVEETGKYLGVGIGSLINILNPELVILAGGMTKAGDILFNPIRKYAKLNSLKANRENVKIVPAKLGEDAGAVGAIATVLKRKGMI